METTDRPDGPAALRGKVCLVTGGAQGIGLAVTRALAGQGAHVHVAALTQHSVESASAKLRSAALESSVTFHLVDVSNRNAFEKCIADAHAAGGRLDILVNNAAFTHWRDVADTRVEDTEQTMRTGYDAMVYGVKAALPLMRAGGGGHIVNMGSAAGVVFVKGPSAAYAAVKAAINAYTQILAGELAWTPVHVMLVRPGTVSGTEFFGKRVPSNRMPRIADFLPVSTPEQVADAILDGLRHRRTIVDVPGYLPLMYRSYALAPQFFAKLASRGGPARRDFAKPANRPSTRTEPQSGSADNAPVTGPGSPALRLLNKLSPGAVRLAQRIVVPLDTALHRHSTGRLSTGRGLGVPSLLLTSRGARSGKPRHVPLYYAPHRDGYGVVGSNFGLLHHPAWTANLLHHPRAVVTTAGRRIPVTARLVEGEEREEIWQKLLELGPAYQTYSDRSGRDLRIFHLQPTAPEAGR
ncbi:SDR family NAD(P)-dependent oxidoreductase [Kitasatospora sp. NPDC058218]|uniref:SDR family NAD(P)-dependent oxidoreductase n=1 Tax=Kitasatospora sp. NPDC058218 TaxID=3346385 RepID=UPI0036DB8D19